MRESFLLCPIHTHVKIDFWFFRKNVEEIWYCTKSSLVIFVRKHICIIINTAQQKFVWFRYVENLTPRSILLVSGTFCFQKIHSIGWMLVLKSNIRWRCHCFLQELEVWGRFLWKWVKKRLYHQNYYFSVNVYFSTKYILVNKCWLVLANSTKR